MSVMVSHIIGKSNSLCRLGKQKTSKVCIISPLWGESTGHSLVDSPHKGSVSKRKESPSHYVIMKGFGVFSHVDPTHLTKANRHMIPDHKPIIQPLSCFPYQLIQNNSRDHFLYAPSQSETTLRCNAVSHWLSAYTTWSLNTKWLHFYVSQFKEGLC